MDLGLIIDQGLNIEQTKILNETNYQHHTITKGRKRADSEQ